MTTTILLTGATDGLGRAVADRLADDPDTVLIAHGRSPERLAALEASLRDRPARVLTVRADLSVLAEVRALADEVATLTDSLNVLVNNAGVGYGDRSLTLDGNELRFGVNHLASFALTQRLLPLLTAGAPSRVVQVASLGQSPIDFDDLTLAHGYSGTRAYGVSKLAMITAGLTFASRVPAAQVTVNSLHPGTYMPTKMVMDTIGYSVDPLETGVESVLHLVRDPSLDGVTGRFFDRLRDARASDEAYDPTIQQRLWDVSTALTS
ncbi:SDR family NAD(P)-dependent oxidoreductase [Cellulomonas sp. McL0617]|uniref:SDR family NAD(P)-dependent oxidoreductase n=1 Tax=Cellulomonas sp. McL0617 TaxID=3415675 RepID=UPI003CF702BD